MSDHDPETLLLAVLAGERSEQDPEVQATFATHPELAQHLARLRALEAQLDAHGREAREILAEAATTPSPHDALVRKTLHEHLRPRPQPWAWLALAAVLLVGAAWTLWPTGPGPADANSMLDLRLGELRPQGTVANFDVFRWHLAAPAQGSYVVRVHPADGSQQEPLVVSVTAPEWHPTAQQLANLPARILWEVEVLDAAGAKTEVAGPVLAERR